MTKFWIAVALLVAMVIGAVWCQHVVWNVGAELTNLLEQTDQAVRDEDWSRAAALNRAAIDFWNGKERYLNILLRHSDTDQVGLSLAEAASYIETKSVGEYATLHRRLTDFIMRLCEMEQLTVANIL